MVSYICNICGCPFDEENIEKSIENHLKESHFLEYSDYYEISVLGRPSEPCWKCGHPRYTISPWLDTYYLPCPDCFDKENEVYVREAKVGFDTVLQDYQAGIIRSKYYQFLLSLNVRGRQLLLPKSFPVAVQNLTSLKKQERTRFDKSHILEVTNILGTSPELSSRNLSNLRMEAIEYKVTKEGGRWKMGESGYYVKTPEPISYDPRHHYRSSILNPASKRSVKRIRIGTSKDCFKFYSTPNSSVKSILSLENESGRVLSLGELGEEEQRRLKFGILKTKEIMSVVFDIYNEIVKYVERLEDRVFLLNSIPLFWSPLEYELILGWSWEEFGLDTTDRGEIIKLSIL